MTTTTNVYRSEQFKRTMMDIQSQCCSPYLFYYCVSPEAVDPFEPAGTQIFFFFVVDPSLLLVRDRIAGIFRTIGVFFLASFICLIFLQFKEEKEKEKEENIRR